MNIVVLQDYLRSGGTERQSLLLSEAFAAAGHRVALLTFRPGGALDAVPPGVTRRALQSPDLGLDWFAPGLVRTVRSFAPDVVLCMGRMANCHGGGLQANLPHTAVVATLRTGKSLPWLFRRTLHRVRHIAANSCEARANALVRHGLDASRVSVIYNSLVFSAPEERRRDNALRSLHGARTGTTVLLCVAMFRPEKNQRELIEIVSRLPADLDWQLWLAGDGPARAACERLAAVRTLAGRVKFLGWQRNPAGLYAAANIAVHASASEALSNFLIEAQAHGLPSVACEAQGISECCVPGDTGFVVARGDRDAFCAHIVTLAREGDEYRQARSARAQAFARTTFDRERQASAYLELFSKLITPSLP